MIIAKNTVAIVATLAIVSSAMETPECQCEYGDFWYVLQLRSAFGVDRTNNSNSNSTGAVRIIP